MNKCGNSFLFLSNPLSLAFKKKKKKGKDLTNSDRKPRIVKCILSTINRT